MNFIFQIYDFNLRISIFNIIFLKKVYFYWKLLFYVFFYIHWGPFFSPHSRWGMQPITLIVKTFYNCTISHHPCQNTRLLLWWKYNCWWRWSLQWADACFVTVRKVENACCDTMYSVSLIFLMAYPAVSQSILIVDSYDQLLLSTRLDCLIVGWTIHNIVDSYCPTFLVDSYCQLLLSTLIVELFWSILIVDSYNRLLLSTAIVDSSS